MKYLGLAYTKRSLIYINPNITLEHLSDFGIPGVQFNTKSLTKLKLKEGEQYFFILLHEIGHFKKHVKPPREFIAAKDKLVKMYPDNLKMQYYAADTFLKIKKSETVMQYDIRKELFREWLQSGDYLLEHHNVEEWAITEFKKHRKIVKCFISNQHYRLNKFTTIRSAICR